MPVQAPTSHPPFPPASAPTGLHPGGQQHPLSAPPHPTVTLLVPGGLRMQGSCKPLATNTLASEQLVLLCTGLGLLHFCPDSRV